MTTETLSDTGAVFRTYRAYRLDMEGRTSGPPLLFEARDDAAALLRARASMMRKAHLSRLLASRPDGIFVRRAFLIYRKRNHHPVHRWMLSEREKSSALRRESIMSLA